MCVAGTLMGGTQPRLAALGNIQICNVAIVPNLLQRLLCHLTFDFTKIKAEGIARFAEPLQEGTPLLEMAQLRIVGHRLGL